MHKIEMRRIELDFSVAEVAILCDVSPQTIYRIESESGKHKVRQDTARSIALGLDSQLHTLFERSELTHLGRPPKTGHPIVDIASRKKHDKELECPDCNIIGSEQSGVAGYSECCNAELVAS